MLSKLLCYMSIIICLYTPIYPQFFSHTNNVIYEALCFDAAQGRMNGAPNTNKVHIYKLSEVNQSNSYPSCKTK